MPTKFLDISIGLTVSRRAEVQLAWPHRFVRFIGDLVRYADEDEFVDGVLLHSANEGDECRIAVEGILPVMALQPIAAGELVIAFDDGVARPADFGNPAELLRIVGRAVTAAGANELVMVQWSPHTVWGANAS